MMPPLMSNHGNFIVSLGNVCRWLATQGRGARRRDLSGLCRRRSAVRRGRRGRRRRHRRHGHRQGRQAQSRASPAAWSCAPNTRCSPKARAAACRRQLIARFGLDDGREPQKFGIGLKELWQVAPEQAPAGAGAALVRLAARQLAPAAARSSITSTTIWCRSASSSISTTTIRISSPFEEFQRFKTHPLVARHVRRRQAHLPMARARITEGG